MSENITINFTNTLGLITGDSLVFTPSIPISSGSTTGTLVLTATTAFNLLNGDCTNTAFTVSGGTGVLSSIQHTYDCNIQSVTPTPTSTPNVTPTNTPTPSCFCNT